MTVPPDLDTVTRLLAAHVDPAARCSSISRAPSGNSQETWFVEVEGVDEPRSLVLRRSAAGGTLEWSDRRTEVAVLSATAAAGLPVPRVRWWEPDGGTLERAYVVMDRAEGSGPDLRNATVRRTLASDLGRLIAELHQRVSPSAALDAVPPTVDSTRAQLEFWTRRARDSPVAPPIVGALCGWLSANLPDDDAEAVLLWGDPGPHNVLTNDRGEITALLDWELAHAGHPLFDLGAARWSCLGHLDRDRLTDSYEDRIGAPVDRETLGWFEVLACVSRSVMLFDGVEAVLAGRSNDPNLLGLGLSLVAANLIRAAELAWAVVPAQRTEVAGDTRVTPALRPSTAERDLAISRYLTDDVLGELTDPRIRRGLKIAAALLSMPAEHPPDEVPDADDVFESERRGAVDVGLRQRLVDHIAEARRTQQPLRALYGDTVTVTTDRPASSSTS